MNGLQKQFNYVGINSRSLLSTQQNGVFTADMSYSEYVAMSSTDNTDTLANYLKGRHSKAPSLGFTPDPFKHYLLSGESRAGNQSDI